MPDTKPTSPKLVMVRLFHRHRPDDPPVEVENSSEELIQHMVRGYEQVREPELVKNVPVPVPIPSANVEREG